VVAIHEAKPFIIKEVSRDLTEYVWYAGQSQYTGPHDQKLLLAQQSHHYTFPNIV